MADDADEADKGGDADYARRLIAQRIPETNRAGFRARRERRFADLVLAVIDAMGERFDQLEVTLNDSRHTRRSPGRDRAAA